MADAAGPEDTGVGGRQANQISQGSPTVGKRGRGRPKGSTKKKETVESRNLMQMWGTQGAGKEDGITDDELSGEDADDPLDEQITARAAFQTRCKLLHSPSRRPSQASTNGTSSASSEYMGTDVDKEESADHDGRAPEGEEQTGREGIETTQGRRESGRMIPEKTGSEAQGKTHRRQNNPSMTREIDNEHASDEDAMKQLFDNWRREWENSWRDILKIEIRKVVTEMKKVLDEKDAQKRQLEDKLVQMQAKLGLEQSRMQPQCGEHVGIIQKLEAKIEDLRIDNGKLLEKINQGTYGKAAQEEKEGTSQEDKNANLIDEEISLISGTELEGYDRRGGQESLERRMEDGHAQKRNERQNEINEKPGRMTQEEWKAEQEERRRRKKNVRISGVEGTTRGMRRAVEEAIQGRTGIWPRIWDIIATKEGTVVELTSVQNKIDIMRRNQFAEAGEIVITDDPTYREQEVQNWIESLAKERRETGEEVRTGHQKIRLNGEWKKWHELEGKLITEAEYNRSRSGTEHETGPGRSWEFRNRSGEGYENQPRRNYGFRDTRTYYRTRY